jgi:transcriptional regulator with XRE-family HTH domain
MLIGDRLRAMREAKKLSQTDLERRTGLLRCYISRVENGHTVPSVETLEKFAGALEIPVYQIFYDGEHPPEPASLALPAKNGDANGFGSDEKDARLLDRFRRLLGRTSASDRKLLLCMANKMAKSRAD